MRFLITGGCGFLGSNLAAEVLKRGHELFVFDNLFRQGASLNLEWLRKQGDFKLFHSDIRSYNDVETAVKEAKPDVVFHLAGQVAMTTSLINPRLDFEINVLGGHNLLESIRKHASNAILTYSSTNKVYGDMENIVYEETTTRYIAKGFEKGFDETLPLHFESPYGCSKGAIDQYMLDYARMFGLQTVVFRHSSIFGGRQFSTVDQGWVGWFCKQAIDIKNGKLKAPFTISGNGKQVRDILFAPDLINCYFSAIEHINVTKGRVYNIGGGHVNSLSLLELFTMLEKQLAIKMDYTQMEARKSDQKVFIANIDKSFSDFNWSPKYSKEASVSSMVSWILEQK
jgi:CDP-paratose 2-epimerase